MQYFACEKNTKKRETYETTVSSAQCAVPAGGKEGCIIMHNPPGGLHAKELVQEFMHPVQHARRVRRIQSLRAFRRPHLDDWMLGCFEDWREYWEDWEDWEDQEDWVDREDC